MDNDKAGETARDKILDRFPFALNIEWPDDKKKGLDVSDVKNISELIEFAVYNEPFSTVEDAVWEQYEEDAVRDPSKPLGYDLTKFKGISSSTDGIQPGFYVVGAATNVGKTAFLCNLTLDLLETNEDVTGIYISLDDNKKTIINRMVGIITGMHLNDIRKINTANREKIESGYDEL